MGRYLRLRDGEIVVPGPSWRKIWVKKKPKKNNLGSDERTLRVAALRELRDAERRGNDAPWKAWKTQKSKTEFSTLSTGLGNPAKTKAPDFHISTAPAAAFLTRKGQNMKSKLNFN